MRRVVDSVIFLLVAYSLCWPLVRGFAGSPAPRGQSDQRRFAVDVIGSDVVPAARLRFARSARDATSGEWIGECAQTPGVLGTAVTSAIASEAGWVSISINGVDVDARAVPTAQHEATTEFALPRETRLVTGRVAEGQPIVRVEIVPCAEAVSSAEALTLDVPCDADGHFLAVIPTATKPGATVRVCTESGAELARFTMDAAHELVDLGELGG